MQLVPLHICTSYCLEKFESKCKRDEGKKSMKKRKKNIEKNLDEFFHVSRINCRRPTILNQTKCDALCGFHFVMFFTLRTERRHVLVFVPLVFFYNMCCESCWFSVVDVMLKTCCKFLIHTLIDARAEPFFSVCLFGVLEFLMKSNKIQENQNERERERWAHKWNSGCIHTNCHCINLNCANKKQHCPRNVQFLT